ncbi:MAG: DMT family protein [Rhodospirillaceae bacterium]
MKTIMLLFGSNVLMTIAWYAHLKFPDRALILVIFVSWGIAFFEYCLAVPANRIGYFEDGFTGGQLKIIQEVVTLLVFAVFAVVVLGERLRWSMLASFVCMLGAVYFIFQD